MACSVAKIAVSAATYWIDRPYEYLIPEELSLKALKGSRVRVPFSQGNRMSEGIILSVGSSSEYAYEKLKSIAEVLDDSPVLSPAQIQLALFMRERFFCTVYDAVKAMLPAGLWFNADYKTRVKDSTVEIARLTVTGEEAVSAAESKAARAPNQARLLRELSSYGEMPVRDLLLFAGASRASLKALEGEKLLELYRREVFRSPVKKRSVLLPAPELTAEQRSAFEGLEALSESGGSRVALLQGVTGSGKTSVYISLIKSVVARGLSAVLLVPEIALTPQMLETFSAYFGDDIAVLHSSLSAGERYDEYKRLKSGRAHIAIGTRSAVFAPLENIGVFIIDEEQEDTYRSENTPRYSAREVARYRAFRSGALLVLGSATPDVCTRYAAETGEYSFFSLQHRYNAMHLPEVKIVDMKQELRRGNAGVISSFLADEISANIERGEQSILFLNRRGAHKFVTCAQCGFVYSCPKCSVSLTYHSVNRRLMCHYCGYSVKVHDACPQCGGALRFIGAGTQLAEEELRELLPEAGVIRMDTDVLSGSVTHEQIFEKFRRENIPVLLGTQMVTKGLNFENVTLVGVLSADQSLYSGDFRASEKTFSLITQVVGRSGRGSKPGRAVIQTYTPSNEVILQAAGQDYEQFYSSEIAFRRLQGVPPFCNFLSFTASGPYEREVVEACRYAKAGLAFRLKSREDAELLGPVPLPVVKVNNRFRYRVLIKCAADAAVRRAVSQILIESSTDKRFRGISFYADSSPEF